MSDFLKEAFKNLDILNEDTFSLDKVGIQDLKDFMNGDIVDDTQVIIDPEAETEEDLKDSYIGDVILRCETCESMIYKKPEEVIVDEEDQLANVDEECPFCHTISGYKIVGQIGEYCPHCDEEDHEDETVEEEEVEVKEETPEEEVEEKEIVEESLKEAKEKDLWSEVYGRFTEDGEQYIDKKTGTPRINKGFYDYRDQVGIDKEGNILIKVEKEEDLAPAKDIIKEYEGKGVTAEIFTDKYNKRYPVQMRVVVPLDESKKPMNEEFSKIEIETDTQKMKVESDDDGRISVEAGPKEEDVHIEDETIRPVSPETEEEIEINSEEAVEDADVDENVDIDLSEFEESDFDELGESYLKEVYDNIASYKTTSGKVDKDSKIVLEGLITFKSGKRAKTNFTFSDGTVTKDNKLRFLGENLNLTKKKNAFVLKGRVQGNKFLSESLTYNYNGKDSKSGKSKALYGTVTRK
nr:MAG TPA: zinc-ribbon containing domain protein [Caudoviricetes sp.]